MTTRRADARHLHDTSSLCSFPYLASQARSRGHEGGGQAHDNGGHEGEEGEGDTHLDL